MSSNSSRVAFILQYTANSCNLIVMSHPILLDFLKSGLFIRSKGEYLSPMYDDFRPKGPRAFHILTTRVDFIMPMRKRCQSPGYTWFNASKNLVLILVEEPIPAFTSPLVPSCKILSDDGPAFPSHWRLEYGKPLQAGRFNWSSTLTSHLSVHAMLSLPHLVHYKQTLCCGLGPPCNPHADFSFIQLPARC
jgi:hypothetical protein